MQHVRFPAEINLHYCGPDMPGGVGRHASAKIHLLHSVDRKSINAVAASLDKPGDHVVANAAEELVLGPVVGLTQQYHRFGPLHLRSEEHTSELQSLMRTSYAVFC